MQSITALEHNAEKQPNSIEIQQTLAEAYAKDGRWEEAAKAFQRLTALYPDTAALFINRIRLGAAALMISSVLILAGHLIQPDLNANDLASALDSSRYLIAQVMFMLALALYSCSAISIYKLLSYTLHHRPAFWAMVISVIGVGLSMPALGVRTFVYPLIGKMMLGGQPAVSELYAALNSFPLILYFNIGGYLLTLGIAVFVWVIARTRGLALGSALIFLAGWAGITLKPGFIGFGIVAAIGGFWLGMSLWNQAALKFDPTMDRTQRS